jgi:hypothetical protein
MKNINELTRDPSSKINFHLDETSKMNIINFQNSLGCDIKIPVEYQQFLLDTNGGSFLECVFHGSPIGTLIIVQFLSISEGADYSLLRSFKNLEGFLPIGTIPFAEDPAGNSFIIGVSQKNNGAVFFWEHETREVYKLNNSFGDFINNLVKDE